jgi:hypothetical protein
MIDSMFYIDLSLAHENACVAMPESGDASSPNA